MKEAELFGPIKKYFEASGYLVDGEVGDCDMLMTNGDEYIAIELKNDLNFKLFTQAAKRQKLFEKVYVAVWSPKNLGTKAFRDKVYLLNRLGIGLIFVTKRARRVTVYQQPVIHPLESYRRRNKKLRERTEKELTKRRSKSNTGGVRGEKVLTAYREDSLLVLNLLQKEGALKASKIKENTGIDRAYGIVYNNHYGWFVKEGKGIYGVTDKGLEAFADNKEIIDSININEITEVEDEN